MGLMGGEGGRARHRQSDATQTGALPVELGHLQPPLPPPLSVLGARVLLRRYTGANTDANEAVTKMHKDGLTRR